MAKPESLQVRKVGGHPLTRTVENLEEGQDKFLENPFKNKFDLRTVIRDPRTGQVIRHQPYSVRISESGGEVFIRDGKSYTRNGQLIGNEPVKAAK